MKSTLKVIDFKDTDKEVIINLIIVWFKLVRHTYTYTYIFISKDILVLWNINVTNILVVFSSKHYYYFWPVCYLRLPFCRKINLYWKKLFVSTHNFPIHRAHFVRRIKVFLCCIIFFGIFFLWVSSSNIAARFCNTYMVRYITIISLF